MSKKKKTINSETLDQWLAKGGEIKKIIYKVDFSDPYKFEGFGRKNGDPRKTPPQCFGKPKKEIAV